MNYELFCQYIQTQMRLVLRNCVNCQSLIALRHTLAVRFCILFNYEEIDTSKRVWVVRRESLRKEECTILLVVEVTLHLQTAAVDVFSPAK